MTPDPTPDDAHTKAVRRQDATLRHRSDVTVLLARRPDLEGVVAMADLIHEGVRWAA